MVTDADQSSEVTSSSVTNASVTPEASVADSVQENVVADTAQEAGSENTDETVDPAAPAVPAYVPNYKLKVYDKEQDLEDPFLKALIKDADSEKKVKEIAQKYLGFDTVKEKNQKITQDFQAYHQQAAPVVDYYNKASKFLNTGDLDGFFEFLKVPQDAIFKYAVQKAEEAQLAPDQRAFLQNQRQVWKEKVRLEETNQSLQSSQAEQLTQFRSQELGWVMARPDVHGIAQAYDTKVGQPGAFRQLVIDKGLAHHAATMGKSDLSAEQATMEVLKYIGVLVQPGQAPAAQLGTAPSAPLIQQNGAPPIIPNVTGRGTSPVKKQVRSLEDLKKRREDLMRSS